MTSYFGGGESDFFVGLDLGQATDYTALTVVKRNEAPPAQAITRVVTEEGAKAPKAQPSYDVVHLERLKLGTPYPAAVRRVREIVTRPELQTRGYTKGWPCMGFGGGITKYVGAGPTVAGPKLVVDATGVGRPVVDLLKAEGLEPVPVTITGGDQTTYDGGWRVPKRDLVSALQVVLQAGRLKVARELKDAQTLVDELLRFRVKIDPLTAHDSYGAWREGAHDDLVLAVAIAVWYAGRQRPWGD